MTLAEYEAQKDTLREKCVRLLLEPDEALPESWDCLSLTAKREKESRTSEQPAVGTFDWGKIIEKALKPLTPPVRGFIEEKLQEYQPENDE